MTESARRFRVLYPDGQYTRLLTWREAEPLFQLWGTEILEVRRKKPQ